MDFDTNSDYYNRNTETPVLHGVQYRVVTDLATEPVTLAFFKEHARIDFDTDDTIITAYIKAARIYLEQWAQLSFGVKTINLKALYLPSNYKLMYGYVNTITTSGYTNFGDILKDGGTDIDIEYTTIGVINDDIKIAICRMAASYYIEREARVETKFSSTALVNEAQNMIRPYANLSWF